MSTYYDPSIPTPIHAEHSIAISIVSNSRLLCEGLISLLQTQLEITLANIYRDNQIAEATMAVPVSDHMVLIDCGLGTDAAAMWTRFWRSRQPAAYVIVFELTDDRETVLACIEAGAGGYTMRGATVSELTEAIQTVRRGGAYCSAEITGQLFTRIATMRTNTVSLDNPIVPITPREMEVLTCVADGMSNQEIAARLVIEIRTVKHHVHNILDKLQVRSRWQAARIAREQNWLPRGNAAGV